MSLFGDAGSIPLTVAFTNGIFDIEEGTTGTIPDSSAICAYIERKHPEPPCYPSDAFDYGRALWIEEYAELTDQDISEEPGIEDIRSGASGTSLDGTAYADW